MAAFRDEVDGYLKQGGFKEVSRSGKLRFYTSESTPNVVVSEGGFAQDRARESVAQMMSEFNPHLVVSAGFAGGTRMGQTAGSVVICDRLVTVDGPAYMWRKENRLEIETNPLLMNDVRSQIHIGGSHYQIGACMTVPQFVSNSSMKEWIGRTFDVSTVDMESYWVAEAARNAKVPWLPVRVVLDTVDQDVSRLVGESLEDGPVRRALRSTKYLIAHPGETLGLLKLSRQVSRASKSLASFLSQLGNTQLALRNG